MTIFNGQYPKTFNKRVIENMLYIKVALANVTI